MSNLNVSQLNNETQFSTLPTTGDNTNNAIDKITLLDEKLKKAQRQNAVTAGKLQTAVQNEVLNTDGTINLQLFAEKFKGSQFNAQIVSTISKSQNWKNKKSQSIKIVFTRIPQKAFASLLDNFNFKIEGSEETFSLGLNTTSTKLSALIAAGKLSVGVSIAANFVEQANDIPCHVRITDVNLEREFNALIGNVAQNSAEITL